MSAGGLSWVSLAEVKSYHLLFLSLCLGDWDSFICFPLLCNPVLWRSSPLHPAKYLCALFLPVLQVLVYGLYINYMHFFLRVSYVGPCFSHELLHSKSYIFSLSLDWMPIGPEYLSGFKLSKCLFGYDISFKYLGATFVSPHSHSSC